MSTISPDAEQIAGWLAVVARPESVEASHMAQSLLLGAWTQLEGANSVLAREVIRLRAMEHGLRDLVLEHTSPAAIVRRAAEAPRLSVVPETP